jgi:hypothetical protein
MTTPAPPLVVFVAETRTGRVITNGIPISAVPRTGFRINSEGPLSFTVPMSASFNKRQIADFLYPWKYSFGVRFGSFIVQYGPLTEYPEYDPVGEDWSFDCAGMWKLFNTKRALLFDRNYTGLSRRDQFIRFVTDDLAQTNGDLPIDLPALNGVAGSGALYPASKYSWVGELLRDQTDDGDDGLEAEFRPYFPDTSSMDFVRHRVDLARFLGRQDVAHQWRSNQGLMVATPTGGGSRIADVYIVPGQSSGATVLVGQQQASGEGLLSAQNWPLLHDVDNSHSSVSSAAQLQGFANGNYAAFHRGSRLVQARVRVNPPDGLGPRLGQWNLGDVGNFQVSGYFGVPDGAYVCRIIGADLASLEDIDLELMLIAEVLS